MGIVRDQWQQLKASDHPLARVLVRTLKAGAGTVRAARDGARSITRSENPVLQFAFDPQYRWKFWVRLFKPSQVHQVAARTRMDRYPEIFGALRDHLGADADVTMLSFGCSTGEEVMTLRQYFPRARLVGAEINPRSLATARARGLDDRIHFIHSEPRTIAAEGPYDVILCMAVLQRDPQLVIRNNITSLAKAYPFRQFDSTIRELDGWLKPGGLLVVHHAHYLVTDTGVAAHYAPLPGHDVKDTYAKFDRSGQLISVEHRSSSILQKSA